MANDFYRFHGRLSSNSRSRVRTALFIEPLTAAQLIKFPKLRAVGVAGMTRSMTPLAMK